MSFFHIVCIFSHCVWWPEGTAILMYPQMASGVPGKCVISSSRFLFSHFVLTCGERFSYKKKLNNISI